MLRYAQGVLKGRPLKTGGTYTVTNYRGEIVAQFQNGALARFYDDGVSEQAMAEEKLAEETRAPTIAEVAAAVENPDPDLVISAPPEAFHPLLPDKTYRYKKLNGGFSFERARGLHLLPSLVVCRFADGPTVEFSWLLWSAKIFFYRG